MALKFFVDPWDPDFGTSSEAGDPNREPPPLGFPEAEELGLPWAATSPEKPASLPCIAFIDGVRRVDMGMFAEEADAVFAAAAGTWAVGAAWSSLPPRIDDIRVRHAIFLGYEGSHPPVTVTIGPHTVEFKVIPTKKRTAEDLVNELQNHMRKSEAELAEDIAVGGVADIVVQDGPLTYTLGAETKTVGLIKRQVRAYLEPDKQRLLAALTVGQRTPLFTFRTEQSSLDGNAEAERPQLPRFSWYARIGERRPIDGRLAGLVRLELAETEGLETARRIADLTTAVLPTFAAPMWRDSRSPQNLYPVGQLETTLRHRMGERELLRRALQAALWREGGVSGF